jgi:small GTP-binding protein
MVKVNIGLVGLPSAGKSSIINSLIGKRLAQSGVSRTTLEAKFYDKLQSDDNINFNIYDLPGIADIEDKDNNFDKVIFDTIKKCNIVIWVSDIIKAFITNHELKEFTKIQNYINELATKEGIPIQLLIMLSKVDKNLEITSRDDDYESCNEAQQVDTDELVDDEDTTIVHIFKNVKDKFKDIDILCFNAHGRSYHHKNSSTTLKNFVKQYNPVNMNIEFNIRKYYDNIPNKNDETKINYFLENYIKNISVSLSLGEKCDTTNVGMPSPLKLFCMNSNCNALDCKIENCSNCSNDKYHFACVPHNGWIKNRETNNYNGADINWYNTTVLGGWSANTCTSNACNFGWHLQQIPKILCKHGYNIKKCMHQKIIFEDVAKKFMEIYKSLMILDNKIKMVKFLLYDSSDTNPDCNLLGCKKEDYNVDEWNMLCKYVNVDIKIFDYLHYYSKPTKNQIYRIIQIGKDLTIFNKLYLYSNAKTIELLDKSKFIKDNINNIDYLLSGKCFEITTNAQTDDNNKYTTEIFNTKLLKQVKEIREKVFGEAEKDIDISMIPIAYEKYGLFWKPIPYSSTN